VLTSVGCAELGKRRFALDRQPILGVIASVLVIGSCLTTVFLLPADVTTGWAGLVLTACVPPLVVQVMPRLVPFSPGSGFAG
jgi:hypothetical protein